MNPIIDTAGWQSALDRMEADLAAVLNQSAAGQAREDAGPSSWEPPSDLGPIPAELRERARRLALAQQDAIHELQITATSHRKHAAFIDTIPTAGRSARAVYLDTMG